MKYEIVLYYADGYTSLSYYRGKIAWSKRTAIKHYKDAIQRFKNDVEIIRIVMREA